MERYELLLNQSERHFLPPWEADSRIRELEEELKTARLMVVVLKQVIKEKDLVIRAAALGGRI